MIVVYLRFKRRGINYREKVEFMENENIGQYIRARRLEMKLSQAALGHKIGKSSQVISNWERGFTKGVSVEALAKIAEVLQVDIRYFIPNTKSFVATDARLQAIIEAYPRLTEHTKEIIDNAIREDVSQRMCVYSATDSPVRYSREN